MVFSIMVYSFVILYLISFSLQFYKNRKECLLLFHKTVAPANSYPGMLLPYATYNHTGIHRHRSIAVVCQRNFVGSTSLPVLGSPNHLKKKEKYEFQNKNNILIINN